MSAYKNLFHCVGRIMFYRPDNFRCEVVQIIRTRTSPIDVVHVESHEDGRKDFITCLPRQLSSMSLSAEYAYLLAHGFDRAAWTQSVIDRYGEENAEQLISCLQRSGSARYVSPMIPRPPRESISTRYPIIKQVYHDSVKKTTCVLWRDGTKTIVKLSENDADNVYAAVAAAYVKRCVGSTSKFHKMVDDTVIEMKVPENSASWEGLDKLAQMLSAANAIEHAATYPRGQKRRIDKC